MRKSYLATALPLAMLAGCGQQASAPVDTAKELAAIHKMEEAQVAAFASRDLVAGLAPYVESSAFAQCGAPLLEGLPAIRPTMEAMLADPASRLEVTPKGSFVSAGGDLAVTTGDYAYTYTDPTTKQPVTEKGVNQTVWQKQADGSWKNVSDFNVATAPAAAE